MNPISFPESNITFAKNQPPYLPLPALKLDDKVISCWQMTWRERLRILWTGKLWLTTLTFGRPIQPQRLNVWPPFVTSETDINP